MTPIFKRLFFRAILFLLIFILAKSNAQVLQNSSQTTLSSTQYSLPNNLPFQYSAVMASLPTSRIDIKTSFKVADARPEILRQYLHKFKSPLEEHSDLIVRLADQNNFDYRWLVAIAQQESNLCKRIPVNSYNCWGWGIYPDPNDPTVLKVTRFQSYEDALNRIAPQFKKIFIGDASHKDPSKVMQKYTPPSDGSWAFAVNQFFSDME